jgi:hypothetical protein
MTGEGDAVCENIIVADDAVVRDVDSNHQKVAGTNLCRLTFTGGAVEGAKLPNEIIVANYQMTSLTFELHMLWLAPEDSMFKNAVPVAQAGKAFDHRMSANLTVVAYFDMLLNNRIRSNANPLA